MIDQSLVAEDILFVTHRDRALYLGRSVADRPRWLKENADKWRRIQDVRQEAALQRAVVEKKMQVGAIPAGPSSRPLSRDGHNDGNAAPPTIVAPDYSRPHARPVATIAEKEIVIGARRYIGAQRLAAMLGVSIRTLSRWDMAGDGPPKIKIGRKVVFDLSKIPEWLATREIRSTRATGQH